MSENLGADIIRRLKARQLPQMVDWFDPNLLVHIGIRDMISGTIGQYADQRLMQAASDHVASEAELVARYDYSNLNASDPIKRLVPDANGAIWVDYISDLGDGFEATYAMAYLMAPEVLKVAGVSESDAPLELKAGEILIMGGDQAYPQATAEEYEKRLINPYNWAFPADIPRRKLFAIPGNHDWYDGLGAFTSLFTSARSRITDGLGRQIGGWRCMQHRSYFAIKLPYDWWIWGPDIQLDGNLDDPQRDYFDIVSDFTKPGDKIVLCLAEPSWHHEKYENLHEINLIARKNGAKVCAVLAGDWHHYSRYTNKDLGVQLVTSGGGGAFAHASHQLKSRIALDWAVGTKDGDEGAAPATVPPAAVAPSAAQFGSLAAYSAAARSEQKRGVSIADLGDQPKESAAASPESGKGNGAKYEKFKSKFKKAKRKAINPDVGVKLKRFDCDVEMIYPSRAKSRLLCLKNLALPFRNRSFALFVGFVYFLYAWVFQTSAPDVDKSILETATGSLAQHPLNAVSQVFWAAIAPERVVAAARNNPAFFFMLLGLWAGLVYYVELGKGFLNGLGKIVIGALHFLAHLSALLIVNLFAFAPSLLLAILPAQFAGGSKLFLDIGFLASYSIVSILLGGLVGALIMGLYWTLTSFVFNMHCGDAFGALGIKDYKHFLRLKFEAEQLTIYPIAIDRVPGRKGWHEASPGETEHGARIVPNKPLAPHLIEPPIVIRNADVPMSLQRW